MSEVKTICVFCGFEYDFKKLLKTNKCPACGEKVIFSYREKSVKKIDSNKLCTL